MTRQAAFPLHALAAFGTTLALAACGGGGGGSNSAGGNSDTMGAAGSGLAQNSLGIDRDPAQVSGMAVNFNGESIGVGPDNLFKMIHRRYDLQKTQGNFIGGAK